MASEHLKNQRRSPRQARARATWEAIIEAAAQILERHGPEGLNTNAVAERAGVSIGTLYQYFPDKHAILAAAARRELGEAAPLTRRQGALVAALIALVERLGGLGGRQPAITRVAQRPPTPRKSRRGVSWERRWTNLIETILTIVPVAPALRLIPIRIEQNRHRP